MNPIFDFAKWLLEKNIRTKNAISVLLALVALAVFCFCTQDVKWLAKLSQHGPLAFPVVLFVVFLITLLTVSLISSAIVHFLDRASRERKRLAAADKKEAHIFKTLESLTGWQQGFVLRYIVENTTQIQEFEVGEYHAVWKPEMEMLIQKGIIRRHRKARIYEIEPAYRDYLLEHWDQRDATEL